MVETERPFAHALIRPRNIGWLLCGYAVCILSVDLAILYTISHAPGLTRAPEQLAPHAGWLGCWFVLNHLCDIGLFWIYCQPGATLLFDQDRPANAPDSGSSKHEGK